MNQKRLMCIGELKFGSSTGTKWKSSLSTTGSTNVRFKLDLFHFTRITLASWYRQNWRSHQEKMQSPV